MTNLSVREALAWIGAALLSIAAGAAHANWPEKPVRIVVSLPGGQAIDQMARAVATVLADRLKQPVIVENRPGAGGNIGMEHVARSAPDGHTLLLALTALTLNPHLYRVDFDSLRDFAPVTRLASQSFLFVAHPSLPATTVAGVLALARSRPGVVTCGHATGALHIACAWFEQLGRADFNLVPYKGGIQALSDVVGGHVDMTFGVTLTVTPHARAGRLRVIATTRPRRGKGLFGDTPTMAETLTGFELESTIGLVAPAGTPPEIVARLNGELQAVLAREDIRAFLATGGLEPVGGTPQAYAAKIARDHARYGKIVSETGIRAE
jgi:tripartite-type tricarboxylate transporter receptor subunit TctC